MVSTGWRRRRRRKTGNVIFFWATTRRDDGKEEESVYYFTRSRIPSSCLEILGPRLWSAKFIWCSPHYGHYGCYWRSLFSLQPASERTKKRCAKTIPRLVDSNDALGGCQTDASLGGGGGRAKPPLSCYDVTPAIARKSR